MARELGVRKLTAFKLESIGTYGNAIPLKMIYDELFDMTAQIFVITHRSGADEITDI